MPELLIAIASLCQVSSDNYYALIEERQLQCQKYYLTCMISKGQTLTGTSLVNCILERN